MAIGEPTYTIQVKTSDTTTISDTLDFNYTTTHNCYYGCNCGSSYWNWSPSIWYSYSTTKYLYQIKCPKCKKTNWLELDTVKECIKCDSTLKAVSKKVDFEIEIND